MTDLQQRVVAVQDRLRLAVEKANREPGSVELMGVSKNHGPDAVREAWDAGITLFGENRVQEAAAKIPESPGGARWHLIGHLQRNKARPAVELFETIHSIDSWRLFEAVHQACEQASRRITVFLEVNVSGESVKFGFQPAEVPDVLTRASEFHRMDIVGLMTIPPLTEDPEGARPHFRALREYRDRWQDQCGVPLPQLSMGMSHDMEVAIAEGSTLVRVGTALFGPRPKRIVEEA